MYHLLLPLVESYWITLTFFVSNDSRNQAHEEESLYNKIQWLVESLYTGGQVKFYEACMLQSIKNAVQKFVAMGVITKKTVKQSRSVTKTYYQLSESFRADNDKVTEIYE